MILRSASSLLSSTMRRQPQQASSPTSLPFVCVLCRYMTSSRRLRARNPQRQQKTEPSPSTSPSPSRKSQRRASSNSTATSNSNRSNSESLAPSSSTSVTAPWSLDPTSPLTKALDNLSETRFADASRIALINHSLERGLDATVRVGVLGGPGVGRFVRVLLADETEFGHGEEDWEKRLVEWGTSSDSSEKKGIIIRYGSSVHFTETLTEPVAYLSIPSRILQGSKVGILLTKLPDDHVPTLEEIHTPTLLYPRGGYASSRTPQILRYPEHKTLVFNNDLDEFLRCQGARTDDTVLTVVNVMGLENPTLAKAKSVQVIDLGRAERALKKLRGKIYSKQIREKWLEEWALSGVDNARSWVLEGATLAELEALPTGTIHPVMSKAIASVLSEATQSITKLASPPSPTPLSLAAPTPGSDIPPDMDTPDTLGPKIEIWATNAHSELSLDMKSAFQSPEWKALSWYSVLWDGSEIMRTVSSIVYGPRGSNGILATAERSGYELFGRIRGAGFIGTLPPVAPIPASDKTVVRAPTDTKPTTTTTTTTTIPTQPQKTKPSTKPEPAFSSIPAPTPSFPTTITHFRTSTLLSTLLPPFLLRTSSLTTSLLTSTSTLLLLSTTLALSTPLTFYSSFSLTAFGTALLTARFIFAWERAKREFENKVKAEGVKAIKGFKGGAWGTLGLGRRGGGENVKARCDEGRRAVEGVRRILRG